MYQQWQALLWTLGYTKEVQWVQSTYPVPMNCPISQRVIFDLPSNNTICRQL